MDLGLQGQVIVLDIWPEPLLLATARTCLEEGAAPVLVDWGDGAVERTRRAVARQFGLRCRALPARRLKEEAQAQRAWSTAGREPLAGVAIASDGDWATRAGPWWSEASADAAGSTELAAVLLCGHGSAFEGSSQAALFSMARAGFRTNVVEVDHPAIDSVPEEEFARAAALIVFLMSRRSAYFHGRVFHADRAAPNVL